MSFLNNNSNFISARITKKGRNSIAKGNFEIKYFQIGDSEFDYTSPFTSFNGEGGTPNQKVFAPFDIDGGVKYPYKIDSLTNSTTYGVPIDDSYSEPLRNVMGSAGLTSAYGTGTTVECYTEAISISSIDGSSFITVSSGNTFQGCDFITLVFNQFGGLSTPIITGQTNSLIYKITGITGNVLYLDRPTPDLSSLTGNVQVVCNSCENEYVECQTSVDYTGQLNAWTMNIVWDEKPIGADYPVTNEGLTGYSSNIHVSTKEFLGYNSTGQTFTNLTGGTIDIPTSYINSYDEEILVEPYEQRCIAVIHYSDVGDITIDPDRFFKYDDYISQDNGDLISIATDEDGNDLTDKEYFQVYLPFIYYHRNTGTTIGALFNMDETSYYIKSTKNQIHELSFRYLIDEQGYKVGKIFPNNKTIVFDDQELVAILDYRSNRKHTLGAPKVFLIPSDDIPSNSIFSGSTGQTIWVTYMLSETDDTSSPLNNLPSNYFVKIDGTTNGTTVCYPTPSNVVIKFTGNTFQYMNTTLDGIKNGFIAKRFKVLVQKTNTGELPLSDSWKIIDYTTQAGGDGVSYLDPAGLVGVSFIITESDYESAPIFDLETYMGTDYLQPSDATTEPQFADQQPFPGSIKLVRATDIQVMNFSINLPSTQFLETQNPTYVSGADKKVTDIALLNSNKEVMVVAKTGIPVTRVGTQVFSVKIDF